MTIVIATKQMEQKMKGQVLAEDFEKRELKDTQHKLLNKAQANIESVEKGTFGVGH